MANARVIKEKLETARAELDAAKRDGNLAKAGELSYGVIPQLEKELNSLKSKTGRPNYQGGCSLEQIAQVVDAGLAYQHLKCLKVREKSYLKWKIISRLELLVRKKLFMFWLMQ